MRHRQRRAVERVRDDRLRVHGVVEIAAFVIGRVAEAVGAAENDVARLRLEPGLIEDIAGNLIGEHPGLHAFTIGQRRGLRLDHILVTPGLKVKVTSVATGKPGLLFTAVQLVVDGEPVTTGGANSVHASKVRTSVPAILTASAVFLGALVSAIVALRGVVFEPGEAYLTLATLFNSTRISAESGLIRIRHGPVGHRSEGAVAGACGPRRGAGTGELRGRRRGPGDHTEQVR